MRVVEGYSKKKRGHQIMMTLLFLIIFLKTTAQVQGFITNKDNAPISFVSVYFEGSKQGTTSNDKGYFELPAVKTNSVLIFQSLGYKTVKKQMEAADKLLELAITLEEETFLLSTVSIKNNENPAHRIIRNAIANRKKHLKNIKSYTADFYSKGIFRIKDLPEKFLGQKIDASLMNLDSTRSGAIYLSETVSKLTWQQKPYVFNERVVASKVSGDDNGFSFNRAMDLNFNPYENTIDFFEGNLFVSPIATTAFSRYKYKLAGTFYEGEFLVNKIEVSPKNEYDKLVRGYIYIIEDLWSVYGFDFSITGKQLGDPILEKLEIKQSYLWYPESKEWLLNKQILKFKAAFLSFKFNGQFTAAYSNYDTKAVVTKKEFKNEVLKIEKGANKKDSVFWNQARPLKLTLEEIKDYKVKDSIQVMRKSEVFLDSIDTKDNRFKLKSLLRGYTYKNSYKNWSLSISSPIAKVNYNTVQGFNDEVTLTFNKFNKEEKSNFNIQTGLNYGLSEKIFRPHIKFNYLFNQIKYPRLSIEGGKKIEQFNNSAISPFFNGVISLIFKENFAKYYDKTFAKLRFSKEWLNGLNISLSTSYEERAPLFNNSNYSFNKDENKKYTSNNPLQPTNFISPVFTRHKVLKMGATAQIQFDKKYVTLPNQRYSMGSKYPTLILSFENNIALDEVYDDFSTLKSIIKDGISLKSMGYLEYELEAGAFFNGNATSFVDYKHFNGNQTYISTENVNAFSLMPYYKYSTNRAYLEIHAKHDFDGFILNKLPLIKRLGLALNTGYHAFFFKNESYYEFSLGLSKLGIGKFRFLTLNYVWTSTNQLGVVFGLQF